MAATEGTAGGRHAPAWGKIVAIAVIVAAMAAAWRYTPLSDYVTAQRISAWARAFGDAPWAPFALILVYTPSAFVLFPRPLLTLFGVVAFGPWAGFAYSMVGIVLSALATYYAGRLMPERTVRRVAGSKAEKVTKRLRKHGLATMIAIRLVPAAPFAVEGILAGAARLHVGHYVIGTIVGMVPGVLATSVFGTQIAAALEDVSKVNYAVVGATLVVIGLITFFAMRWVARSS